MPPAVLYLRSRVAAVGVRDWQFAGGVALVIALHAAAGYRVQALIAYGEHWYPWYMRRLAERPANVVFAIRQLLP